MEHWLGGNEKKSLWEKNSAFLHACIAYFVSMLLFVGLRVAGGLGWFGLLEEAICGKDACLHWDCIGAQATDIIANVLIQIVIFLVVPLVIFKVLTKEPTKKVLTGIGFNRPSGRVIGFAFLLGLMFYVLNIFVASISQFPLTLLDYRFPGGSGMSPFSGIGGLFIGLLMVGVLPGVCEEVSNRGILMRGFMSKLGVWRAVLLSSLIFGLIHMNIAQAIYTTVLGVLIAIAILATRSLWTGIIIHFMNNALAVLSGFMYDRYGVSLINMFLDLFGPLGGIVFFILPVVMYIFMIKILHMFARQNFKANEKEYIAEFLKNNPEYISQKMAAGQAVSLDEMSASLSAHTQRLSKFRAIRFYLEGQRKPQKLNAIEKTFVFGMVFLTSVVTVMTLVWGLPPFF